MDPVGPWSAYASYNRLAGVQTGGTGTELHHHLTPSGPSGAPPTTTAQLLSGGFLSPPPVGYETVFSPLFHHAGAKSSAHYVTQVTQHRQALAQAQAQAAASKQTSEGEYHQTQVIILFTILLARTTMNCYYRHFSNKVQVLGNKIARLEFYLMKVLCLLQLPVSHLWYMKILMRILQLLKV